VPSEYTGTLVEPPPATVEPNVDTEESVTNDRDPAPAVDALGRLATVTGAVVFSCEKMLSNRLKYNRKVLFSSSPNCRVYSTGALGRRGAATRVRGASVVTT
jgi:hypothetical protein